MLSPPRVSTPPRVTTGHDTLSLQSTEKEKHKQIPAQPPPKLFTNWQKRFLRPTKDRMNRKGHTKYKGLAADYLYAQHIFTPFAQHIFNDKGQKQSLDNLLKGKHGKTRWTPALSNEWGRLAQGNDSGVEFTNTIDFIPFLQVPQDRKVMYASFACDH